MIPAIAIHRQALVTGGPGTKTLAGRAVTPVHDHQATGIRPVRTIPVMTRHVAAWAALVPTADGADRPAGNIHERRVRPGAPLARS